MLSPTGAELKEQAIAHVIARSPTNYAWLFRDVVHRLSLTGFEFTSEDVTRQVGQPPASAHPNTVGALMNRCAATLRLERVGDKPAVRANQHATRISVWRGTGYDPVDRDNWRWADPERPCWTCGAKPSGRYPDGSPQYDHAHELFVAPTRPQTQELTDEYVRHNQAQWERRRRDRRR